MLSHDEYIFLFQEGVGGLNFITKIKFFDNSNFLQKSLRVAIAAQNENCKAVHTTATITIFQKQSKVKNLLFLY
jgi:hypothetical protein